MLNNPDRENVNMGPDGSHRTRGSLKIFIGYAPGVGKTFTMLNEANRRLKRGEDVVAGFVASHGRPETELQIGALEIIPRRKITSRARADQLYGEEMDTEAIIARKPQVVVIDELAHTNFPGAQSKKRHEDIEAILEQGINVLTTLNIQHLESLNDIVREITGITVQETIPDQIVARADEVIVVDLTPEALLNRLRRGNIYQPEQINHALKTFFRKGNLNALRELALRQTAAEVDDELTEYMAEHGINDVWHTVERAMVCISSGSSAKKLIRRGARIAKRYKCEWYVVHVHCAHFLTPVPTPGDPVKLESHFKLGRHLGAEIVERTGKSVSGELAAFALEKHITQIIIGHPARNAMQRMLRGSTISKLLRKVRNAEIHVIPNEASK